MPVLTEKEYQSQKQKKRTIKDGGDMVKKKPIATINNKEIKEEIENVYVLQHPENSIYSNQNFHDKVKIDDKEYDRICVNGLIRTKEKILADWLIKNRGYFLLELKEA